MVARLQRTSIPWTRGARSGERQGRKRTLEQHVSGSAAMEVSVNLYGAWWAGGERSRLGRACVEPLAKCRRLPFADTSLRPL